MLPFLYQMQRRNGIFYRLFCISFLLLFVITGFTKEYRLYINYDGITESFHMVADSDNPYLYVLDGIIVTPSFIILVVPV